MQLGVYTERPKSRQVYLPDAPRSLAQERRSPQDVPELGRRCAGSADAGTFSTLRPVRPRACYCEIFREFDCSENCRDSAPILVYLSDHPTAPIL
jgi:hypothetical protein